MDPKMVKVCILASGNSLNHVRIFYKQARSLVGAGYHVSLITYSDRRDVTVLGGVKMIPIPKEKGGLRQVTAKFRRFWAKAIKEKADIYQIHDLGLILVAILLKLKGYKVIYDLDYDTAKYNYWLEKGLYRFFPLILATDVFEKLYATKRRKVVVQNYPQLSLFPEIFPEDKQEQTIVYLGAVTKQAGISVVLEALYILKKMGRKVRFECIGEVTDTYRAELDLYCAKVGIRDQVSFHHPSRTVEAYRLAGKCAAGMAVTQLQAGEMLACPTHVYEYMALQLPVITSNSPLMKKMIQERDCGLIVNPLDPKSIAGSIRYLLDHPEEGERMGENGRGLVESQYNWIHEEAKLLKFYQEVVS